MLVKLKVRLNPNCNENIIKSSEMTPDPSGDSPAKENSMLLKKNSRTTLSGKIHPNSSPNKVPKRVPKNKINAIIPIDRLFIDLCVLLLILQLLLFDQL